MLFRSSPRFANRYMPEQPTDTYITRSYMFGGPWHFMNPMTEMTPGAVDMAAGEIQIYKNIRRRIRDGRVYHLTPPPDSGRIDALESFTPVDDTAIVVVTRLGGGVDVNLAAERSSEIVYVEPLKP